MNHFSLIIFYHSICLGFKLFGLRVQVYSQLVQFTFVCKGYDNHHCHNNPPDRKWGCSGDDVMPGRDCPANLRILKKSQLRVEWFGHWVEELSFSNLYRQRWSAILNITRCAERWDGVSVIWLRKTFKNGVSLLVSMNWSQEINKPSAPEQQSPTLCCICVLHL